MSIAQSLLPEYDHEMAGCRKTLERVPDEHFDYKPHAKSFSMEQLANHLATIPGWVASTLNLTELDFSAPETVAGMPPTAHTRKALLDLFDQGVAEGRALLAQTSDEAFAVTWTGKSQGQVVLALPRIAVYRGFIMNHAIHHRAQLCGYFRMLDIPVPALYGPSADETGR